MSDPDPDEMYEPERDELANSVTHGLGVILSIAGLAWLVTAVAARGDAFHMTGAVVFGVTLVLLYASSALYHGVKRGRLKKLFMRCDYAGIFMLIAGTYTAVLLMNLRNALGLGLLALVWILCLAGVVMVMNFRFPGHFRLAATFIYIALGWLVLAVIQPLMAVMPGLSLRLLLIGGGCYTFGVVFFLWHRLPYHHAIWHIFVLAGSACHWVAVAYTLQ
jgi:hemolysin III